MNYSFREEPSLNRTVTFILNKDKPVYNWFYFKEGYSKEFVDYCIDRYGLKGRIVDPFCGSGTTLLAAKERGLESTGVDVSPLAELVSKVKTRNYDISALREEFSGLKAMKPEYKGNPPEKWIRNYFYGRTISNILFYRNEINKLKDKKARDFFLLALINATDKTANAIKQGASLKRVKKGPIPVKHVFVNNAKRMIRDLKKQPELMEKPEAEVLCADSRTVEWKNIDCVITSPPYMNKIEYTSVYKIELCLFFKQQETRLRAFISDDVKDQSENSLGVEEAYFKDLRKVLENLYKGLNDNGTVIFELAGGCFPDRNIEADERLAEIGEDIGFKCKEIVEARKIQCHRARTFKTGTVRESLVVLEKM